MLTDIIVFDIHNFKASTTETFVVPNTPEFCEKVLSHHFTREISFQRDFSVEPIQFRIPVSFINYTAEDEIDDIDQMH